LCQANRTLTGNAHIAELKAQAGSSGFVGSPLHCACKTAFNPTEARRPQIYWHVSPDISADLPQVGLQTRQQIREASSVRIPTY
jgi:hypothetical protein